MCAVGKALRFLREAQAAISKEFCTDRGGALCLQGSSGSVALLVWLLMCIPHSVRELGGRAEAAGRRVSRGEGR